MRLPILLQSGNAENITCGTPPLPLNGVFPGGKMQDRRYRVSFNSENQRRFGTNEWGKLVSVRGDLKTLAIAVDTEGVPGVGEYWRDQAPGLRLW